MAGNLVLVAQDDGNIHVEDVNISSNSLLSVLTSGLVAVTLDKIDGEGTVHVWSQVSANAIWGVRNVVMQYAGFDTYAIGPNLGKSDPS